MSYLDAGYNDYLESPLISNENEYSSLDFDAYTQSSSVNLLQLANNSVSTAKVQDAAITNAKIKDLAADKITAGTITVSTYLGGKNILLDGENIQIVINDGSYDRVIIGQL